MKEIEITIRIKYSEEYSDQAQKLINEIKSGKFQRDINETGRAKCTATIKELK